MEKIKERKVKSEKIQKLVKFSSFAIYILFIFLFFNKIYSNTKVNGNTLNKKNDYDSSNLNYIETVLETLKSNDSYKGPKFPADGKLTKDWMLNLIEYMKDIHDKKSYEEKYLDKYNLLLMLLKGKRLLSKQEEALIDISIPEDKNITVVGDIHGQFYDLLHIFEINGYPSENNYYLFNGDFVDRGLFSIECIVTLIGFKILYPDYFFLARGNHEDKSVNVRYGFRIEIMNKYEDERILDCFDEFYKFLPLAHVLNGKVLVLHGGLFNDTNGSLDQIRKIYRFVAVPSDGIMCDILWSDPREEKGIYPSDRGAGIYFGPDVTEKFLKNNNLTLLIRSHEVRMEGYQIEPGEKVITVFSAPNYCDQAGNLGAFIKFRGGEMSPIFIQFDASPHP